MTLHELVTRTRSHRRFIQSAPVSMRTLHSLVDLARLAPCAGNMQPLKYVLSSSPATNASVFPHLRWAAYLRDWTGPAEGERPAAYIIICRDNTISSAPGSDHGFAVQNILLGATELGLGACIIGSIDRDALRGRLHVPEYCEILAVVALGQPAETVRIEPLAPDGNAHYWRDAAGIHHVPKRMLQDIIISEFPADDGPG